MVSQNILINRPMLEKKASEVALRLKTDHFNASNWWLDRYKKCHGISCKWWKWQCKWRYFGKL